MSPIVVRKWVGAACLLALTACESAEPESSPASEMADSIAAVDTAMLAGLPSGTSVELLGQGRELYVVCSVCHGLDGRGTQLGPSLRDTTWIHIPAEIGAIAGIVRDGVAEPKDFPIPMPVMGGGDFDEDELRALATYVYALGRSPS